MKDTVMEALSHQSEIYRRVQRGRAGAMAGEWPQRGEGRSRVGDPSGRLSIRVLFSFSRVSVLGDQAKQSVFLVGDSGREIDAAAERKKIPQAVELKRSPIGAHKRL